MKVAVVDEADLDELLQPHDLGDLDPAKGLAVRTAPNQQLTDLETLDFDPIVTIIFLFLGLKTSLELFFDLRLKGAELVLKVDAGHEKEVGVDDLGDGDEGVARLDEGDHAEVLGLAAPGQEPARVSHVLPVEVDLVANRRFCERSELLGIRNT